MVKHIVAELFDPPGNDARLATIVTIGLIHKQRRIARGAIDLGKPILIVQRFRKPIPQADEFISALIDVQCADRQMIHHGSEADPRLVERITQDSRRPVFRQVVREHSLDNGIQFRPAYHARSFLVRPTRQT